MRLFRSARRRSTVEAADNADRARTTELYRIAQQQVLACGLWSVASISLDDKLTIRGYAIPPYDAELPRQFLINGEACEQVSIDVSLKHLVERFALAHAAEQYTFALTHPRPIEEMLPARVECHMGAKRDLATLQDWFITSTKPNHLPPPSQRARVAGTDDPLLFESVGLSTAVMLRNVLSRWFGRRLEEVKSILDWGCGCGRTAKFIAGTCPGKLVGVDIDEQNIRWCSANIRCASFHTISLQAPTAFESSTFDFIYGISVFTHLKEPDQSIWLAELARLARPGAAVLMSVNGAASFLRVDGFLPTFLRLNNDGLLDYGRSADLDAIMPDTEFYRNIVHAKRYVFSTWNKFFDVLDILPAVVAGHQDLVVMRAR